MSTGAGAAVSRLIDVRAAARDAGERALRAAGLERAGCVIVAGTVEQLDESIDLCDELQRVLGHGVQIIGGATSAALVRGDAVEEGPALGLLVLGSRGHVFSWSPDQADELRGAALAAGPGALGLVFADPAAPLQRLISSLSREAAGARVAGGGVVAEGGLLRDDDLASASAVGIFLPVPAGISSGSEPGARSARVAVAQSHQPVGKPCLVTRAEGRDLLELDHRPALQALAALAELPGLADIEGALPFLALGVSPSPGEPFREDDFVTVPLLGVDEETGGISVGARVEEGQSVCFTLRDGMGARRTLEKSLHAVGGATPAFGVYFDCASRGTHLYGVEELDLGLIEKALGTFPLLSLRTTFELGPSGTGTGLHLFTGVLGLGA